MTTRTLSTALAALLGLAVGACADDDANTTAGSESAGSLGEPSTSDADSGGQPEDTGAGGDSELELTRLELIKQVLSERGILNALPFAAVARHESAGIKHCANEAEWACEGPSSPDCDDGPTLRRCELAAGVGMFQVNLDDALARGYDPLTERGNIEAGVDRILGALWADTQFTPLWSDQSEMINWLNGLQRDTDDFEAWLTILATAYHPPGTTGKRGPAYLHKVYESSTENLLIRHGADFWETEAEGISQNTCSCDQGIYHDGTPIPIEHTHCGFRVCGLDDAIHECTSDGWKTVNGLSCGQNACSCAQGINHNNAPVPTEVTECEFRVCSLEGTFFSCQQSGWFNTQVSCPLQPSPEVSCKCSSGLDQNNNPIDPNITYCGMQVCGNQNQRWECAPAGWVNVGSCDEPPPDPTTSTGGDSTGSTGSTDSSTGSSTTGSTGSTGSTSSTGGDTGDGLLGFGFPIGDKTSSPGGGWGYWRGLGVHIDGLGGHLASDLGSAQGAYQDFFAVADGKVLVQDPNGSSYKHIILIEHEMGDGTRVCSFYGHIDEPYVNADEQVTRGQAIGTVMEWPADDWPDNHHLHYAIVPDETCTYMMNSMFGSKCGYDEASATHPGVVDGDPSTEPWLYYPVDPEPGATGCRMNGHPIHSATQFIDMHHYSK